MKIIKIFGFLITFLFMSACKEATSIEEKSERPIIKNNIQITFSFSRENFFFTWDKDENTISYGSNNEDVKRKTISDESAKLLKTLVDRVDFQYLSENDYAKNAVGDVQFVTVIFKQKGNESSIQHSFMSSPPIVECIVKDSELNLLKEEPSDPFDAPEHEVIEKKIEQEYLFWFLCMYVKSLV